MPLLIWFLSFLSSSTFVKGDCSRSLSRVVRNVFTQKIEPEFERLEVELPTSCPFRSEKHQFGVQERYKRADSVSRWTCLFCGKAFYDEVYLDRHFERKHNDHSPQDDATTCLADYCDVFRCDVITGRLVAQYWDRALCKETVLTKLQDKCQDILGSCIPQHLDIAQQNRLFEHINSSVCSYLTCARYWESLENQISPAYTALYITAAVFSLFGLLIYYFVAYSHFYTDESLLDGPRHRSHGSRTRSSHDVPGLRQRSNYDNRNLW